MKRFNQAWTLHPANVDALHGMAIVCFEYAGAASRRNDFEATRFWLDQAVELAEEGGDLLPENAPLLTDTALIYINRGQLSDPPASGADLDHAEALLKRAEALDPHAQVYRTWATLERVRGREDAAERHDRRARELSVRPK